MEWNTASAISHISWSVAAARKSETSRRTLPPDLFHLTLAPSKGLNLAFTFL